MSLFLTEGSYWTFLDHMNISQGISSVQNEKNSKISLQSIEETLLKQLRRHNEFTNVIIENSIQDKKFHIILDNLVLNMKGIFTIRLVKAQSDIVVSMLLLNQHGHHIKSCSPTALSQIVKAICFNITSFDNLKISLHPYNLSIKITLPYFCLASAIVCDSFQRIQKSTSIIIEVFKEIIRPLQLKIQKVLPLLQLIQKPFIDQDRFYINLMKYSKISTISCNFVQNTGIPLISLQKKKQQFLKSCQKIFQRKKKINTQYINNSSFYQFSIEQRQQLGNNHLLLTQKQKLTLKSFIALPNMNNTRTSETGIILNYIVLQNNQILPNNYFNGGGFAQIYQGQIKFWQVDSSDANAIYHKSQSPKSMIKKNVVLKKAIQGQKSKIRHQVEIIQQMKNGAPIFVPQYYVPINNKQQNKFDILLIDFLPFPNLKEYMIHSKSHYSLHIRILIAYWIIGALRFLKDYKILHLDLKPANIIKFTNGMIKLIDFGEAHHPNLPFIQPGISQPYTAPELRKKIIEKQSSITHKSDVYSFGVILFELLYNKKPFDRNRKWNLNIQQSQRYGENYIIYTLNWLISKCLNYNPDDRPELQWIAVILKLCLSKSGAPD